MAIGMRNRIFGLEGRNGNDATLIKARDLSCIFKVTTKALAST